MMIKALSINTKHLGGKLMRTRTNQLEMDYSYCEAIIKKHSKSFYYAFSRLPVEKANAVYAIYAFCRIADDSVDENSFLRDKVLALKELKNELDLFARNNDVDHPLWRALRDVFNTFDMDIQVFYDQLIGQEMDIEFTQPKSLEELEQYSYYVAGSVGLMLLPIIASENHFELKSAAVDLGVAMQITNILRDVGEDYYEKGRIYLPEVELSTYKYTSECLDEGVINESFIQLWEKLAVRAEILYHGFSEFTSMFDADSQIPVSLSAMVYRGILDAVRENDYDCLSQRNYVDEEMMSEINITIRNCS